MLHQFGALLLLLAAAGSFPGCRVPTAKPRQTARPSGIWKVNFGNPAHSSQFVRGILPGNADWRWTERSFALRLDAPPWDAATWLDADLLIPREILEVYPSVTITARVNGVETCRRTVNRDQRFHLLCSVPDSALRRFPAVAEFEADHSVADPETGRQRAIIAVSAGFIEYEESEEFREHMVARAREGMDRVIAEQRKLVSPEQLKALLKLYHELPVWESNYYQGIQVLKNPLDLWMMERIIHEQKVDLVIETGTLRGGSALVFAGALRAAGLSRSKVLTIDINDFRQHAAVNPLWKDFVTFLHGSSTDPQIVAQVAALAKGKTVIVALDSDHSAAHVLKELKAYSPLVQPGGYIVVEDTHIDGVPTYPDWGPGPMAAVREFLASKEGAGFAPDPGRESFVMTFNPGGWLRRK